MQPQEILKQLKKVIVPLNPNSKNFTAGEISFDVIRYSDTNELIEEGMTTIQTNAILSQALSPSFCVKGLNQIFINKALFFGKALNATEQLLVITHEYFHLLYPTLGETHIDESAYCLLRVCGENLSEINLEKILIGTNEYQLRLNIFNNYKN
jgi:hypothetical protein